ncbi:LysM peptidoglycan-binding domain-containing protein [Aerococcaceae bacterium zg-ZJ1578]|uniref:glycoside hydrolase family protein n=1 Tax=Aerococcaceae bacterium zg-252 TaxID=2796928 RepID=UPI001A315E94|nr:LysM peptidoglycan-binding domain-containing protein [Aerococcaceae bacterium zg-1578]
MNEHLKISQRGIDLIKQFEGMRLEAYQDIIGKWTIGYGHTHGVYPGMHITPIEAERLLKEDIIEHTKEMIKLITVPLNQNQFDALASFHFNLGPFILSKDSYLLNLINTHQWELAAGQMKLYRRAGNQIVQGLINRRDAETSLLLSPIGNNPTSTETTNKVTEEYYIIKSGDSLWKIAQKFNTTVAELVKLNDFIDQDAILHIGQQIKVKNTSTRKNSENNENPIKPTKPISSETDSFYTILAGDSLWKISQQFNTSVAELVKLNGFPSQDVILHPGQRIMVKKGQSTTPVVPEHPVEPTLPTSNSEVVESSYRESGQFTANRSLSIRNEPNQLSAEVATLYASENVVYDMVYKTNRFIYISYVSYSGTRRYLAIRTNTNGQRGPLWGTIV